MAKPICVIYYMRDVLDIEVSEINKVMAENMPDYYVFCVPSNSAADGSAESMEFKVYYEKDFTEIQYAELKELILNHLNDKT